ncbi:protein ENHANCED DISEASE RESISTANCE 2-like [Vigna radiata var. radiata]|uniref:Protein ENHANCED DISEASE RESISTANCE 2-like n=1 Tax=Vigna radiata var. radiata TaxID=3916 RepID=A0A1S3TZ36_VIGRR|nr:protein ENHANCED DISEASE RESISTANCE 2-like [Vigna radiata var. radiata]
MEASSSGEASERGGEEKGTFQYFGWVYHVGVNSVGREYCHLRFLLLRGKCVAMYKRDPHQNPDIKPIRQGVIGATLVVEDLGCRKVNNGDLYVVRFYSRQEEGRKGEIACATAEEAQRWMEAFLHARQQAEHDLLTESDRDKLMHEMEIDLQGNRHKLKRYASGLKKLKKIGQGPETLLRLSSKFFGNSDCFEGETGDVFDIHQWKCVRTMSGIRIFEDVSDHKSGKGALVKSVGVIDAPADSVFEVFLNTERQKRYEWDMLMGDLELVETYDGHYDVVYGTYDPKYLTRWHSKRDFIFSRQWFRSQDGTYTILQFPSIHKKKPPRSGYRRTKINPSTWEIRNLNTPMGSDRPRCLVSHTLEINSASWYRWKNSQQNTKFEKSVPYALLCQVAGLKEYIGANPALLQQYASNAVRSHSSHPSLTSSDFADDIQDEFYDAIAAESSSDDDTDDDKGSDQEHKVKLKNVSWAMSTLAVKRGAASDASKELDPDASCITIDVSGMHGSLRRGEGDKDTDCWTCPGGEGFMIRGKNYLKDNSKVVGGDPLLKLIAVDWLKVDKAADRIALHHRNLVQSEAGKSLPFILVFNLQVPAKPNYSLVLYYASDRPVKKDSLLAKFLDGDDAFRDTRFKLIPSIVEGYWMVKRAVGTKACLLGKAVTCKYFKQDNFFEIDVDIGSSSVARSVIGLVLGYVTSLVVDLAILIEAKEESELPEYLLGTVRLNRLKPESAEPLED